MIKTSPEVVRDLVSYVPSSSEMKTAVLPTPKKGAHSTNRIIFHEDVTGKEITSTLLREVQKLSNVELLEYTTLVDILEKDNHCYGAVIRRPDGSLDTVTATYTVLASGGVGGLTDIPPTSATLPATHLLLQVSIILNCRTRITCRSTLPPSTPDIRKTAAF